MSSTPMTAGAPPAMGNLLGHPRQLWMLFMSEFWERFAFYGMRWALTLYIVAEFFSGDPSGQAYASRTYGAYLALVYATAIFGGYVADRIIGYQRSILLGAVISALGYFMIVIPEQSIFLMGLATIIVGNGLFKPNISTMVGQLYAPGDARRDRGFTIFYMGINAGALVSPLLTGWLASVLTDTPMVQNYKAVFVTTGIGMVISTLWFWFGRRQLGHIGRPPAERDGRKSLLAVTVGSIVAVPVVYFLMSGALSRLVADVLIWAGAIAPKPLVDCVAGAGRSCVDYDNTLAAATVLAWLLAAMFIALGVMLLIEAMREGKVARDKVFAMLTLFAFNVLFWMFFEQAGSSFNFLAQNIVDRDLFGPGGFIFPTGWFQSVNPTAIVIFAPLVTLVWAFTSKRGIEPSIPRKFGLGLLGNALGFGVLMFALSNLVDERGLLPFWPLVLTYVLQTLGELAISPIGLSMVTKLAPLRFVGLAMGGWFLSTAIGNNLSGIFAGGVSGEEGMTVASALAGFTFSFYLLLGVGILLFLIAPLINRWMHGVK